MCAYNFTERWNARKRNSKQSAKGEKIAFSQRTRVNKILNEKMFKETQTIQREPKYRNYTRSSSEQERKVNALASGAEEGRDKLR